MSAKDSDRRKKNVTSITAGQRPDDGEVCTKEILSAIEKDLEEIHREIDRLETMIAELSRCAASKGASC